jgi:rhomboid family GlyGly-CTERM serine protease
MGLNQGDLDHRRTTSLGAWSIPGLTIAIAAVLELSGIPGRELFRYDRLAIADGEVWRLLSGHLTHLGWSHFVLNAIGLLLVCYLVAARFSGRCWLLITGIVIAGIDLGFWFLEPQLLWYVGLSGVLHGVLAAGAVSGIREGGLDYRLIAAFLAGKLLYEQLLGPLPGSEEAAGGNVVVMAHLYGALSGAVAGWFFSFRKAPPAPI